MQVPLQGVRDKVKAKLRMIKERIIQEVFLCIKD